MADMEGSDMEGRYENKTWLCSLPNTFFYDGECWRNHRIEKIYCNSYAAP